MKKRMFYAQLGKLLYAAANTDGVISHKEKEALEQIVRKELLPEEAQKDEFGTNIAYYTDFEFDF